MDISSSVKCNRWDQVADRMFRKEQDAVNRRDVSVGIASAHDDRM